MASERLSKLALLLAAGMAISALGAPLSRAQTLTENFSSTDHWDVSGSESLGNAGLWNSSSNPNAGSNCPCAQAGVVDNGTTSTTLDFGDGSDGAVASSDGYAFDTDTHPNGYNFVSLDISGGTITVTGSNPLVIRSLTTVTITPSITVTPGNGSDGSAASSSTGPSGGSSTSSTHGNAGGSGGVAVLGDSSAQMKGGNGDYNGSTIGGAGGNGSATVGTAASPGNGSSFKPGGGAGSGFDSGITLNGFVGGGGGGGGGGYATGTGSATGGGGGAGGGTVRIVAVGQITVGNIVADGGNGGNSASYSGTDCSGVGAGGNGGAVWLQSFNGVSGPSPSVSAGSNGTQSGGCGSAPSTSPSAGVVRADAPAANQPGWGSGNSDPSNAAVGTYYVESTAYDLGTYNAIFTASPTLTPSSSQISAEFAASADGTNFTAFTSDITTLSNQNYRYLKFLITIDVTSAGPSPVLNSISIPYEGASLQSVDLGLATGCAGLERIGNARYGGPGGGSSDKTGLLMTALWALLYLSFWKAMRFTARSRRSFGCP